MAHAGARGAAPPSLAALEASLAGFVWQAVRSPAGRLRVVYVGAAAERWLGTPAGALAAKPGLLLDALHEADRAALCSALERAATELGPLAVDVRLLGEGGGCRWLRLRAMPERLPDGSLRLDGVALGLDELKQAEARQSEAEERFRRLADASFEGLIVHEHGRIVEVNSSLARLFDYGFDELAGMEAAQLLVPEERQAVLAHLQARPETPLETSGLRRGGGRFPIEVVGRTLSFRGRPFGVVAVRDISERRRAARQLKRLAFYDRLTGLPNRAMFGHHLREVLARAGGTGERLALLLINLTRFKEVNDTRGHATGDRLLAAVADRLRHIVREPDAVARLGGDEFVVIGREVEGRQAVQGLAERLLAVLTRSFEIDGTPIHIGAHIGIALFPDDTRDGAAMLCYADLAICHAKADDGSRLAFFSADMQQRAQRRRILEDDLRRAIARGNFELHYQPQVALGSGRIVGVEALARWRHPERGPIPPAEFIPVAEASGLILPLGDWVLREACRQARAWRDDGFGDLTVAVNISAAQFHGQRLAAQVAAALHESALAPERLELELTESIFLDRDLAAVAEELELLQTLGVELALDDFGTGYSSLAYLRKLPFSKLKIDRSFVGDLGRGPDAAAVVKAIINLAHSLDMRVIAEGVERPQQLAFLEAQGCDHAQGYLLGRPIPAEAMSSCLKACRAPRLRAGGALRPA